jgi:hypothetical protein
LVASDAPFPIESGNHEAAKKGIEIARNRSWKPLFPAIAITSTGDGTYQIQPVQGFSRATNQETAVTSLCARHFSVIGMNYHPV